MNIVETFLNLLEQTAFFSLSYGNYLMICIALIFLYLGIAKGFEPLLMVPIAFGMLLVNIYPDIMLSPEKSINGTGGLLWYFFRLDEWTIFPSLIFLGVGAQTDFSPLIANPISFLLGAAAQFGIYAAYFFAIFMGFNGAAAAAISIIGGADGPTSIFLCNKLGQTALLGPIAVAAYSYMSLVPIIQPPIMKLLTSKEERKIMMKQPRYVSRLEKIAFPVVMALIVNIFLPPVAPLITMLMLGNLLRECLVVTKLAETASNTLLNMVTLVLTVAIGSTMAADTFLTTDTILIIALGLVAFAFGTGSGVVCAKLMNKISGGRINPLIGSAGIASVPIAARVSHLVGQQESRNVFLLMHAMGPNLAGVFGTAISGGIMLALLS